MRKILVLFRKFRSGIKIIRREGIVLFLIRLLQKIQNKQQKTSRTRKQKINFLADWRDVVRADWTTHPYVPSKRAAKKGPYIINWVMSPPASGGGHQNMLRFIQHLEEQGHTCRIYLYSTFDFPTVKEIKERLAKSHPGLKATVQWLKVGSHMQPADAVFATGWETAYPVFNDASDARKFYFVQDFEPSFYPIGSEYVLAENTYRFNFYGITAGGWLSNKLSKEYGMSCQSYEFGADTSLYRFENEGKRKEIFFYARPVTARRGFELGILALQIFHEKMPNYTITLAGWDVSDYDIPFPYKNLKTLSLSELSDIYNQSAAALVVSLTNMSLMPLELLATGTIPVVTDGPNNRQVSDNPYIEYATPSPDALAQRLIDVVSRKDLPSYAKKASRSVQGQDWDKAKEKFMQILVGQLNG